jgi:hypothetical protein
MIGLAPHRDPSALRRGQDRCVCSSLQRGDIPTLGRSKRRGRRGSDRRRGVTPDRIRFGLSLLGTKTAIGRIQFP